MDGAAGSIQAEVKSWAAVESDYPVAGVWGAGEPPVRAGGDSMLQIPGPLPATHTLCVRSAKDQTGILIPVFSQSRKPMPQWEESTLYVSIV